MSILLGVFFCFCILSLGFGLVKIKEAKDRKNPWVLWFLLIELGVSI
jgi:hypothetical protein